MATAFAHETPDTTIPLARAAGKLALVASAGAEAIAAGLGALPLTFAEARDKVRFLIEAEHHLPDDITDEEVDVTSDRTVTAFKAFFAMPARTADEAFQKIDVIRSLWETYETPYLAEAMAELRTLTSAPAPLDGTGDEALLAAWERWKVAASSIKGGADLEVDRPHITARDEAEQLILEAKAATTAGLLVKLRLALDHTHLPGWASRALYAGDDGLLLSQVEELDMDSRLIVDAIGFLTQPAPDRTVWNTALQAFRSADAASDKHWAEVEEPLSDEQTRRFEGRFLSPECQAWSGEVGFAAMSAESDRLSDARTKAEDRLMGTPAPDLSAVLFKLHRMFDGDRPPIATFQEAVLADVRRLTGPTPAAAPSPVRQAFNAWIAARIAYDLADSALEPDEDPEYTGWIEAERTLAETAPQSAEDMLYKLFPLALSEHGPNSYQGTFELVYKPAGPADAPYMDDSTWRGLIDGMLALCPRIAEVVAMPPVRSPKIKADMWLPDTGASLDQMRDWLGHLQDDGGAYAKLWLRLAAASKLSAQVFIQENGQERFWLGSDMDDCSPESLAVDQELRALLKASGHRQAVIDQLKAVGRFSDLRQAVAA